MFEEYQNAITKAVSDSSQNENDFESKREKLTIEIKNTLSHECDSIDGITLADYNPLKIHNEITKLKHRFQQLFDEKEEAQKKIKETLDTALQSIMKCNEDHKVDKMYKIINSCGNNSNICRVWFALKKIPSQEPSINYSPGDPIRIEWFALTGCERPSDNSFVNNFSVYIKSDIRKCQIPKFISATRLTDINKLYSPDQLGGINSQEVKWWQEWVKQNRPI